MENLGRNYRPRQGGWERGSTSDNAESWRTQEPGRGQSFRSEGSSQGKRSQAGHYKASPKKGALGPLSYSPGGFSGGGSPSQKDESRWFPSPDNGGGSQDDNWRECLQQNWRRNIVGEGPREDREQGWREGTESSANKSGEELAIVPKPKKFNCLIVFYSLLMNIFFQREKMAKQKKNPFC